MTNVRIHPLVWIGGALSAVNGLFVEALLLVLIIAVHELGHAWMAHRLGWRIRSIELLPFGGKLETDEHGGRPVREEAAVTAAGPFMHVILFAAGYASFSNGWMNEPLWSWFQQVNASVLLFNLLPVLPLDGGRFLSIALAVVLPYSKAYRAAVWLSAFFLLAIVLGAFLLLPVYVPFFLLSMYLLTQLLFLWKERSAVLLRFWLFRAHHDVKLPLKTVVVSEETSLSEAARRMYRSRVHLFQSERGCVAEKQLLNGFFKGEKRIRDIRQKID